MTKRELRKLYLEKRSSLSDAEFKRLNFRLTQEIFDFIKSKSVKSVFLFLPIRNKKEFDTFPLIKQLWEAEIQVSVPVSDFKSNIMFPSLIEGHTQLTEKKFGILEPEIVQEVSPNEIDLALVPLLVADEKGNRIGYGGGFYDRFLGKNKHIYKLGVSFFEPIDDISEVEQHDVLLDKVIY